MSRNRTSDRRCRVLLLTALALGIGLMIAGCSEDDATTPPDFGDPILYMSAFDAYDLLFTAIKDSIAVYSEISDEDLEDRLIPYRALIHETDALDAAVNKGGNALSVWHFSLVDTLMKKSIEHEFKYRSYSGHVDGYGETFISVADTLSYEEMSAIRLLTTWDTDSHEAIDMVLRGDVAYDFYKDAFPTHSSLIRALHQLGYQSQGYFFEPDTFYAPLGEFWSPPVDTFYMPTENGLVPIAAEHWEPLTDTLSLPLDEYTEDEDNFYVTLNHKTPPANITFPKVNHILDNDFIDKYDPSAVRYAEYQDISDPSWSYWQSYGGEEANEVIFTAEDGYAKAMSEGGNYFWMISSQSETLFFNGEDTLHIPLSWVTGATAGEMVDNDGEDEWWCGEDLYREGFYFDNEVCPCDTISVTGDYILTWHDQGASSDTVFAYPYEYSTGNASVMSWSIAEQEKADYITLEDGDDYGFIVTNDILSYYYEDVYLMHEFVVSGEAVWFQDPMEIDIAAVRSRMELQNFEEITLYDESTIPAGMPVWVISSEILDSENTVINTGAIFDYVTAE